MSAEDLFAYEAAILSHPGYLTMFFDELSVPVLRLPITTNQALWTEAVKVGQRVIRLHTYGERFATVGGSGTSLLTDLPAERRPKIQTEVPSDPGPDVMRFVSSADASESGHVDLVRVDDDVETSGRVGPLSRKVWEYQISGMNVLDRWFTYRKRVPGGRRSSMLSDIGIGGWQHEYNKELLELLTVLTELVDMEVEQALLLARIMSGPVINRDALLKAGALIVEKSDRGPSTQSRLS